MDKTSILNVANANQPFSIMENVIPKGEELIQIFHRHFFFLKYSSSPISWSEDVTCLGIFAYVLKFKGIKHGIVYSIGDVSFSNKHKNHVKVNIIEIF